MGRQLALEISFTPSMEDWIRGSREYRRPQSLVLPALVAIIWATFVLNALLDRDLLLVVAIVIVSAIVLGIAGGATALSRRREFRRYSNQNEELRVRFDESRVSFHTPRIDSSAEWSAFGVIKESKNFYFLGSTFSLPKRVLTPEEDSIFRTLALRNLPLTKFRGTAPAPNDDRDSAGIE